METKLVKNTSDLPVAVLFNGMNQYFEAGQTRMFPAGIADALVTDNPALTLVDENEVLHQEPNLESAESDKSDDAPADVPTDVEDAPEADTDQPAPVEPKKAAATPKKK